MAQCFTFLPPYSRTRHSVLRTGNASVLDDRVCVVQDSPNVSFFTDILGFHPRDETTMLVYKTIENGPTGFA